ncbi:trypsin-like serine protease [Streptomyces sp. NPDC048387]|uniref:trypsin-like serine protease n=1 Tax=Streptomyces sp. NPDC048387 TaxID=3365542 RepID=UPI0037224418
MEFGAAFPADGKAFELMEQGEGLLHDVAELVRGAPAGNHRQDPTLAQLLCAGPDGGDICSGDEGGPLLVDGKVVGIASWGSCGTSNSPAAFTSVAHAYSWISSQ